MDISERITRWRDRKGITKAELARRVGVSSAAITQWEAGDANPSVESVEKITKALDITMAMFFGQAPAAKVKAS